MRDPFSGPDDTNPADVLPIAIRELESAHAIFIDRARNDQTIDTNGD